MSVTIECVRMYESENAVKIEIDNEAVWIPLSQVESMHFDARGHGRIIISDWIAAQKGL